MTKYLDSEDPLRLVYGARTARQAPLTSKDNHPNWWELFEFDPDTNTLTFPDNLTIRVKGNFYTESEKHTVINSSRAHSDRNDGIPYSVFLNTELDNEKEPVVNKPKEKFVPWINRKPDIFKKRKKCKCR